MELLSVFQEHFKAKGLEVTKCSFEKEKNAKNYVFVLSKGDLKQLTIFVSESVDKIVFQADIHTCDEKDRNEIDNLLDEKLSYIHEFYEKFPEYRLKIATGLLLIEEKRPPKITKEYHQVLSVLTEKEKFVFLMRNEPFSYEEIGRMTCCTRERIRQIHEKAMTKLEESGAFEKLKDILK